MTPPRVPEESGAIAFAERVLTLLDDGSFTATYKYAVLLGLIDLCMEGVSATGEAPQSLTTRQLAEKVIELYWPHTVPYTGLRRPAILRQNTRGQAEIVTHIRRFRESLVEDPLAPPHRAKRTHPERFERLVQNVEWKLIEMPLPRLQRVGSSHSRFVYEIGWAEDVALKDVRQYQRGGAGAFDNRIALHPNVGEYLVQLNGVLRPLLHRHWGTMVAKVNQLEESRLERFLFGTERIDLAPLRHPLLDLQNGACFYCGQRVKRTAHVDHFIPWSRYPDDGIDNLVVADSTCNSRKTDFLASERHVEKWRGRMSDAALDDIVTATSWHRDEGGTLGVARAIYLRLPTGFQLWDRDREFVPADPVGLAGVLR